MMDILDTDGAPRAGGGVQTGAENTQDALPALVGGVGPALVEAHPSQGLVAGPATTTDAAASLADETEGLRAAAEIERMKTEAAKAEARAVEAEARLRVQMAEAEAELLREQAREAERRRAAESEAERLRAQVAEAEVERLRAEAGRLRASEQAQQSGCCGVS